MKTLADYFVGKNVSIYPGSSYDLWVSDENKDSDYSNGIAVVHDIIKSVTIGE